MSAVRTPPRLRVLDRDINEIRAREPQRISSCSRPAPPAAARRRRPADDRRLRPSGPRRALGARARRRPWPDRTDLLDRLVDRAGPPGRRRAARHRRHRRGPAAARRPRGQAGVLVDEPRRAAGLGFEMDDRITGYDVQGTIDARLRRRQDADPDRPGRPGHGSHPGDRGAGGHRAQPRRTDRHGRAVHVHAGSTARSSTTCRRTR